MDRRKWAKDKPCQIRIPGVCNFNPETSVLCHIRMRGVCGIGQKSPDYLAAIGCSSCHDVVDGRVPVPVVDGEPMWTKDEIKLSLYEGVFRTQVLWERQ